MQVQTVLLLGATAVLLRLAGQGAVRRWLIFLASGLAVYALQPALPVRGLDYWLPTLTLAMTGLAWLVTARPETRARRENLTAAGVLLGLAVLTALTRWVGAGDVLLPSRPPGLDRVLPGLAIIAVFTLALAVIMKKGWGGLLAGAVVFLILLLLILKTPALSLAGAGVLRSAVGQNPALASALDIRWLGFSYVVFRLIQTLRDRQTNRLPDVDLVTYLSYVVFFPAFVSGPIDRLERFAADFHNAAPGGAPIPGITGVPVLLASDPSLAEDFIEGGRRFAVGLFKKFVVADLLALAALNHANALQVTSSGWMWLLLYLYAFQIYLDFSGYTDIAIGMGRALGVKLPENFAAPYRKPNLTQFWNSWHMSLTQWFRAYFFNPITRSLRKSGKGLPPALLILLPQVATMLLIGLWHGVTVNFALWGLWHGLGLFLQNRWTDSTRGWFAARKVPASTSRALTVLSTLLTFHYVALGWVWFVIPDLSTALRVFARLFGGG